ncbi:hypothetical protein B9Z19DRAFT_1097189 [Tuber borchii]|uniref:Uncharacterized protein n=1 Tax=Tuber borchii TaxID=42251 RepID=A0A2T6ZAK0_TUBBO|nr:hypothetical protein B9Z19DRAFT_1097189 [Tuber borchii]
MADVASKNMARLKPPPHPLNDRNIPHRSKERVTLHLPPQPQPIEAQNLAHHTTCIIILPRG